MSKDRKIIINKIQTILLADIKAPSGGGRVSDRVAKSLAEHIARTGLYPRLIVRPHPRQAGKYELLDGRLRAKILRQGGQTRARCEVWDVDNEQSEVLGLTLNNLRSRNGDAARRARQVRRLVARVGPELTQRWLALTPAGLKQLLVATARPQRPASAGQHNVTAVVFHLPSEDAALLNRTLRRFRGTSGKRSEALVRLIQSVAEPSQKQTPRNKNRRDKPC